MMRRVSEIQVQYLSRAAFGLSSIALMLLALALIVQGLYEPFVAFGRSGDEGKKATLEAIGYVVIAIAVFDVAKFMIEEEVVQWRERRNAAEARRSLTRFISTLAIAVFLEGLITVFRVSSERVPEMIYPTLLIVAGTVLVLGLGFYQKLSVTVERQVEAKDHQASKAEEGTRPYTEG